LIGGTCRYRSTLLLIALLAQVSDLQKLSIM
jgi:hypothetical protein